MSNYFTPRMAEKECTLYEELGDGVVRCKCCGHYCTIKNGKSGVCGVRLNKEGKLYLAVHSYPNATHIDPMEKKPMYHFYPNSTILSLGTIGCNFKCDFCQNWSLSMTRPATQDLEDYQKDNARYLPPEKVVEICQRKGIKFIAFTYNEPTIWFEYNVEIATLAKKVGIKSVYVSNGFMSQEAREILKDTISGINIDLKSFNDTVYKKVMGGGLGRVCDNIEYFYKNGVTTEVTTLVVPGMNDSAEEIRAMAEFLVNKCGADIPWHLSAFHPDYKMQDRERTSLALLEKCYKIGREAGL